MIFYLKHQAKVVINDYTREPRVFTTQRKAHMYGALSHWTVFMIHEEKGLSSEADHS